MCSLWSSGLGPPVRPASWLHRAHAKIAPQVRQCGQEHVACKKQARRTHEVPQHFYGLHKVLRSGSSMPLAAGGKPHLAGVGSATFEIGGFYGFVIEITLKCDEKYGSRAD